MSLAIYEPEEGGESLHLEAAGESVVLGGVDLGDGNWGVMRGKLGRSESVFRGKLLAVAATDSKHRVRGSSPSRGRRHAQGKIRWVAVGRGNN